MIRRKPLIARNKQDGVKLEKIKGEIELRNVVFSYPSRCDIKIFTNFSLSIPAGKVVAIVGSSGSGKSTVISLIERFYDPTSGMKPVLLSFSIFIMLFLDTPFKLLLNPLHSLMLHPSMSLIPSFIRSLSLSLLLHRHLMKPTFYSFNPTHHVSKTILTPHHCVNTFFILFVASSLSIHSLFSDGFIIMLFTYISLSLSHR